LTDGVPHAAKVPAAWLPARPNAVAHIVGIEVEQPAYGSSRAEGPIVPARANRAAESRVVDARRNPRGRLETGHQRHQQIAAARAVALLRCREPARRSRCRWVAVGR